MNIDITNIAEKAIKYTFQPLLRQKHGNQNTIYFQSNRRLESVRAHIKQRSIEIDTGQTLL